MRKEILDTKELAIVFGIPPKRVRADMKNGILGIGKITKVGSRKKYTATLTEVANRLGISREEVMTMLEDV